MRRRTAGVPGIRVTPSMRRKVDDLAQWLAAGDRSQLRAAQAAIVELLKDAARGAGPGRPRP